MALAKRHSMTGEAIEVGQRARAYRTILTHFSQRYPKIPAIGPSFTASTCIAFDLLSVNLAGGFLRVTILPSQVHVHVFNMLRAEEARVGCLLDCPFMFDTAVMLQLLKRFSL